MEIHRRSESVRETVVAYLDVFWLHTLEIVDEPLAGCRQPLGSRVRRRHAAGRIQYYGKSRLLRTCNGFDALWIQKTNENETDGEPAQEREKRFPSPRGPTARALITPKHDPSGKNRKGANRAPTGMITKVRHKEKFDDGSVIPGSYLYVWNDLFRMRKSLEIICDRRFITFGNVLGCNIR